MRNGIWIGKRKIFPWKPGNLAEYPLKIPGKIYHAAVGHPVNKP